MNKFVNNLKRNIEENPIIAIAVAAAVITATAKLIDAAGHNAGSRAYAKQVNAKIKNSEK